jgi:hypothetical protein
MSDEEKKGGDIFGIAPYGETLKVATQGLIDGLGSILAPLCLPAAQELGLHWRDRVAYWRAKQALDIAKKMQEMLGNSGSMHAHPRLVMRIIEDGSWSDDDAIQRMWAGLLASSCSEDGRDESNLIFVNLLGQLTLSEVRLVNFSCKESQVALTPAGWLEATRDICTASALAQVTGIADFHRLDREVDHLRSLGLLTITAGFMGMAQEKMADITPSSIGLQLYARSQGHRGSPEEFYGVK